MKKTFGKMPRSRIVLETGTHSHWISSVLSDLGHEVIVAHSRNVRLIGESRRKDDRLDAQALARLARIDPQLLSPIPHRSVQVQADLSVIRARYGQVRARTALVCSARGLTKSFGERIPGRVTFDPQSVIRGWTRRSAHVERSVAIADRHRLTCVLYSRPSSDSNRPYARASLRVIHATAQHFGIILWPQLLNSGRSTFTQTATLETRIGDLALTEIGHELRSSCWASCC